MITNAERETVELLRLVTETTAAERAAQLAFDAAEAEWVQNPSLSGEVHERLRADVKATRRALRQKRQEAEAATVSAEQFLKKQGRAAGKSSGGIRGIRWPIGRRST